MPRSTVVFEPASEVARVAEELIGAHHPDLAAAPIVYVFRTPASKSHDRIVLGRAIRVTGLRAFLVALAAGEVPDDEERRMSTDYTFYVMEIAREEWLDATPAARAALVDHELCHFRIDEETGELMIRAHDIEEFNAVVARHGEWKWDVSLFLDACGAR